MTFSYLRVNIFFKRWEICFEILGLLTISELSYLMKTKVNRDENATLNFCYPIVPSVLMQPVTSETLPTQETLEKIDLTVI